PGVEVVQGGADDPGVLAAGPGRALAGELADPGSDLSGAAVQDVQALGGHPVLRRRVAARAEAPGGLPQVFQHVDEVDDDHDGDAPGDGLVPDPVQLADVAVGQRDPPAAVAGV